MLLDIKTHLQSFPFTDAIVFLLLILFFGGLIAYSFVEEVEDLHKEDVDETEKIETLTSGSIGKVFDHTAFDNLSEEDMD